MNLQHKIAVVTGASAGLGRAFSKALLDRGAIVFGLARRADRLQGLREAWGEAFHPVACDVTDEAQVTAAFRQILDESDGRIDILVNNAGLGRFGAIDELSVDDWDVQMATNLRGVFLCTRATLPVMKAQNRAHGFGGHIVNIASVAGLVGNPRIAAYNATKFGLRGFSDALMKEVRDDGIKVTCLYPGSVATDFADVAGTSGSPNPMQPEDVAGTLIHVLEGPDNYLVSEVVMRPLRPRG
ncbi:MAG: SDR family oxidoreductase [Bacteroidetes bacterium]|nr:MAG: SDR family oxidoreductase [Bacteroidota bacterium]